MKAPRPNPGRRRSPTPPGALLRGLFAGSGGTAAMTAYQELVQSSQDRGPSTEPQSDAERWQHAPAPAQVAKRILEGIFHEDVSAAHIPLLTNAMHWLYGTSLGALYGLVQGTIRANPLAAGLAFGSGAWALSYAQLVPMGIYEPPWRYPPKTLAVDLSYHLVYGVGVAGTYAAADLL